MTAPAPSPRFQTILRRFVWGGLGLRAILLGVALAVGPAWIDRSLVVSVATYLVGLGLMRLRHWNSLILLLGLEWAFLVHAAVLTFGWESGFGLQVYALPISTLLFAHISLRWRTVLATLPLLVFLPVSLLVTPPPPVVALAASTVKALQALNAFLFFALVAFAVWEAMRALARERRHALALAQSRTRLIANLSHELKTPLAAMLTTLQGTLARPRDADHYRDTLGVLERNTRGLGQVVRRMLDFVSAEDAAMRSGRRTIDLRELLVACLAELRPVAEPRGVGLELEAPAPQPIETDPDLLAMVFRNLVANAIRYSPDGRAVRVAVTRTRTNIPVVTVRDEGPGIPPDVLPHIFEPFYRADRARSRTDNSFGLGLAIVAEYSALLGCKVGVDTTPGAGTTFVVTLGA